MGPRMKNKILTATLCLFLLFSGVISLEGGEKVYSSMPLERPYNIENDGVQEKGIGIAESSKDTSVVSVTQGIYDFLGWIGSNIQDFLGWAGGNIWDFLAWAGSNTYEGSAALGRGGIILLLVLLLITISYGAIRI